MEVLIIPCTGYILLQHHVLLIEFVLINKTLYEYYTTLESITAEL